jgi:hypothetical protein
VSGLLDGIVGAKYWNILRGRCGRGETCGTTGKLVMLTPGAQLERLWKRRQSGVVDLDDSLRTGWDVTNKSGERSEIGA